MQQECINTTVAMVNSINNKDGPHYQISEEDPDECENLEDDGLLDEGTDITNQTIGSRGPYERAWTTEATRALIHIRGPMEGSFTEGRQKRTALWLHCTRQLQRMGFRYSAAKVQKKWHNILITYNKNLSKKYLSGYVHWEFFEEMFKYLQGKKADFEIQQQQQDEKPKLPKTSVKQLQQRKQQTVESIQRNCQAYISQVDQKMVVPQVQLDTKSNDEFDEDSTTLSEMREPKLEYDESPTPLDHQPYSGFDELNCVNSDKEILSITPNDSQDTAMWKDYFERKLQLDREKIELHRSMHRDLLQINKMSLVQQERIERLKIDAINSLTATLQKLVEVKHRKA